mmetsp:Transcript_124909/g.361305  ORF Transcript_124909/g.361305 Transcript_124909/m.361305 type:complete len:306 (-) Transcript_124909:477-1394(-)
MRGARVLALMLLLQTAVAPLPEALAEQGGLHYQLRYVARAIKRVLRDGPDDNFVRLKQPAVQHQAAELAADLDRMLRAVHRHMVRGSEGDQLGAGLLRQHPASLRHSRVDRGSGATWRKALRRFRHGEQAVDSDLAACALLSALHRRALDVVAGVLGEKMPQRRHLARGDRLLFRQDDVSHCLRARRHWHTTLIIVECAARGRLYDRANVDAARGLPLWALVSCGLHNAHLVEEFAVRASRLLEQHTQHHGMRQGVWFPFRLVDNKQFSRRMIAIDRVQAARGKKCLHRFELDCHAPHTLENQGA